MKKTNSQPHRITSEHNEHWAFTDGEIYIALIIGMLVGFLLGYLTFSGV
jgi:F0F1-type ATP synthase assembly protein I